MASETRREDVKHLTCLRYPEKAVYVIEDCAMHEHPDPGALFADGENVPTFTCMGTLEET